MDMDRSIAARLSTRLSGAAGTLALVSTAHAVNHAYGAIIALINVAVLSEFHVTPGQIGVMVGLASMVAGLAQAVYGFSRGTIRRKLILGGGHMLFGLAAGLTGLVTSFSGYAIFNMIARLGGSPQHPVGNSLIVEKVPPATRGSALAMHVSGGNIGTVLMPLVGGFLIATIGWRATLLLIAVPAMLVGLGIMVLIDEPPSSQHSRGNTPSSTKLALLARNRMVLLIMLASIIAAGGRGLGVLMTYIPLYLSTGLGFDNTTTNLLFTVVMVCSVIGPITMGHWADRVGRRPILLGIYLVAAVATVALIALGRSSPLILALPLAAVGITAYGESSILQAFLADHVGRVEQDMAFALYFAVAFGVGSLWAAVLGWVTDVLGFTATFAVITGTYLTTILVLLPTRDAPLKQ